MSYFKKFQRIGDIITTDLRKIVGYRSVEALDAVHAVEAWRQMLGPTMVRYSEGESFENGALRVRIKSAVLRNDLFMQRTELIQKLNQQLGRQIVFAITFY
jgi:predicted nucleic acid-binding Zn ribbon protein